MSGKIPDDAFDFYVALGPGRSYQAVSDRYGVTKRAVVKHAAKERWAERLAEVQEAARAQSDKDLASEVAEMRDRHRRMLKAMAVRALSGLKDLPLRNGMEAIRAAELVIRMERIVFGEEDAAGAETMEEVTRREIQTLLTVVDEGGEAEEPLAEELEADLESDLQSDDSAELGCLPPLGSDPNAMPLFPRGEHGETQDFVDMDDYDQG